MIRDDGMVTARLPFRPIIGSMNIRRNRGAHAALLSLEADAASARGGFACLFSTSDEFEEALISERRAQGRYTRPQRQWPVVLFVGCTVLMLGTALLLG
jgi:hypothetical protein